ncbi:MAG: hypothetical protein AB8F34_10360 [Akkermansiaceae bacterium]
MQIFKLISLVVLCLVIQACIHGEEDVWIEADGSARVKATYRVPAMLLSAKEAEAFKQTVESEIGANKNLSLITNRIDREKGERVIRLEISTDDVTELENMTVDHEPGVVRTKSDKILHAILGTIELEMDGLNARLKREVDLNPLLEEYLGNNAAAMLSDAEFRYSVHVPKAVASSNAHSVSDDGRVLRWRYGLAELKGQPIVMQMTAPVPLPWWVYAAAGLLVALLLWAAWLLLSRSRNKREANAAT